MKIFIINLKRAKERKKLMQNQLNALNETIKAQYDITFFNAVDAKNNEHLHFKQYSPFRAKITRGKSLSDGERACFASHYLLWLKCIALQEAITILEDDIEILPHFWEVLRRVENSDFSYVRLMYSKLNSVFLPLRNDFFISFENISGAQGYFLTPTAALAFVSKAHCWYRPVDDYMDMFFLHYVPIICVRPILRELPVETTITARWGKPRAPLKIIREISRLIMQIYQFVFLICFRYKLILPKSVKIPLKMIIRNYYKGGGGINAA